eukprot:gene30230-36533_t
MAEFGNRSELTVETLPDSPAFQKSGSLKSSRSVSPKQPLSKRNKKVSFSADTALPRDDNIALSITKHAYTKELGYTQYTITLLFHGFSWTIYKRYRDFEDFHRQLMSENDFMQIALPCLPQKRWFERQRWFNRFDETYGIKRRIALQDYMRTLAKMPQIKERSEAFVSFLEMPPEVRQVYEAVIQECIQYRGMIEEKSEGVMFFREDEPIENFSHRLRDSILEVPLQTDFDENGDPIATESHGDGKYSGINEDDAGEEDSGQEGASSADYAMYTISEGGGELEESPDRDEAP